MAPSSLPKTLCLCLALAHSVFAVPPGQVGRQLEFEEVPPGLVDRQPKIEEDLPGQVDPNPKIEEIPPALVDRQPKIEEALPGKVDPDPKIEEIPAPQTSSPNQKTASGLPPGQVDRHPKIEESTKYWSKSAIDALNLRLETKLNTNNAKNVIMFLGDGMSIATVTAARIYAGQLNGAPGEENNLAFDNFPHTGLSKTYCVDAQVADSACSSTAYLSGVKGSIGTIGVTGEVARKQCDKVNDQTSATSILYWAQKAGKSTGIVTTTRVTHASPAGTYAHTADRDWESDSDVAADNLDPTRCQDIASQLVNNSPGKDINVILGGGWREFLPVNASEEASGRRGDNEDLIKKWALDKEARGARYAFVNDRQSLSNLDTQNTDFLLGLFGPSHMEYHLGADEEEQPTLEEMTRTAINILSRNPKGFFLFVEGGRIDHGHHETLARRALDETVEFSKAVRTADDMTDDGDTLMVTTADHAHTMSFSGYPARGNDILSVAGVSDVDNIPYATLSYANGPGYRKPDAGVRYNVLTDDMKDIKYHFPSGLPTAIETHGGEDVSVYSKGPWAHLLTGVMEQSFIPVAMMYASCLGPHTTMCTPRRDNAPYHLQQVRQDSLLKEATPLR